MNEKGNTNSLQIICFTVQDDIYLPFKNSMSLFFENHGSDIVERLEISRYRREISS